MGEAAGLREWASLHGNVRPSSTSSFDTGGGIAIPHLVLEIGERSGLPAALRD